MGGVTVGELSDRMSATELREWEVRQKKHPLPDPWYMLGMILAAMYNIWTSGKRYSPEDFIPTVEEDERPEQSMEETWAKARMIFGARMPKKGGNLDGDASLGN